MKIVPKISNNIINTENKCLKDKKETSFASNESVLPSVNTAGISMVNANLPVSYTKIADIPVAGINQKAALYKLSNGQKVVILPKKGPTYIRTSFNVGSLNEPDEKRGISHFIEHNLFNGSKDLPPGEYDKKLTLMGGRTNAYTNTCETQYHLNLQLLNDKSLEESIKLNAYQTQFPTFPKEQLEKEKEPVKQEIDMCSDNPLNKTWSLMFKNLFSFNSSSDDILIGTKDNINKLTRDDVIDYYNTWYTPDNAITVITGDVDVDETIKLVSKYYNKKPDLSKTNKRNYPKLVPIGKPIRCDIKQSSSPNTTIVMGFPVPQGTSVREYEKIRLMLSLLNSNESELSQKLDKYGISLNFDVEQLSSDIDAPRVITLNIELPEKYSEEVLKIIYEGINSFINNAPDCNSLNTLIDNQINSLNNDSQFSGNISAQLIQMVNNNDLNYYQEFKNNISSTTPNDILNLARKYLDLNKVSVCISHPASISDEEIINNYKNVNNKASNISFGKSYNPKADVEEEINKLKEFRLINNIEVSILDVDNQADAELYLIIETDTDNSISKAAAMVLSELLNRGSLFKNNILYSKLMKENNSSIGFAVSNKGIAVSSDFKSDNSNAALALIKETLLSPNFTQTEFDRAKLIVKDTLLNSKNSPDDLLGKELNPNSKYYATKEEQLKELDKLTLNDVIQIYNKMLNNSQANVSLAAPVSKNPNIEYSLVNNLSQDFPLFKTFVKGKSLQEDKYRVNTQEKILTAAENNAQASVVQSYQFLNNGNIEDQIKIELLDLILGSGGMSSRLFEDLRNNEKIAYTVGSHVVKDGNRGEVQLYIDTSTDSDITPEASPENVNKALSGFKRNVDKLKTDFVTDEELESAKTQYKTILLNTFESNIDKADIADNIKHNIYGREYYSKSLDIIDKITKEDIRAAADYVFKNPPITSIVASQKTLDSLNLK